MPRLAGRVGPHRESHQSELLATNFLKASATANAYTDWDGTQGIEDWGMDNNGPDPSNPPAYPNGLGCCGLAAPDHGNIAKTGDIKLLGTFGQPKFAGMVATYFAYGVSQGEIGEPPAPEDEPDQGVDNATLLAFLYKNGVIKRYAEVPLDQIDTYAPLGCGLLVGVRLDDQAQQQFEAHEPWDGTPDPQLGHDVWLIRTKADGSVAVISWGAVQDCTLNFRQNNITDAWLIGDGSDENFDQEAWSKALVDLHGIGDTAPDSPPKKKSNRVKEILNEIETDVVEEFQKIEHDFTRIVHPLAGEHSTEGAVFGRKIGDVSEGPGTRE